MPPQISQLSFSKSMGSRNAFGGFTFATFKAKNIAAAPMVMIHPFLRESSMFFFPVKTIHLLHIFF